MNASSVLLCLSVCLAWAPTRHIADRFSVAPWAVGTVGLVAWGYGQGEIGNQALLMLLLLLGCAAATQHTRWGPLRAAAHVLTVGLAFALAIRAVPGFENHLLIDAVTLSPHAPPTTISVYLDPGIAGLVLFGLYGNRAANWTAFANTVQRALPISLATTAIVLGLGVTIGFVEFDPKPLNAWAGLYLFKIAFWTLPLEEAFFRGIIQRGLTFVLLPRIRWATPVAILIASSLFGLAHLHAGVALALLATLAGVGYGCAYVRSGGIEGAFTAHLTLNGLHFLLFTYPHIGS